MKNFEPCDDGSCVHPSCTTCQSYYQTGPATLIKMQLASQRAAYFAKALCTTGPSRSARWHVPAVDMANEAGFCTSMTLSEIRTAVDYPAWRNVADFGLARGR